MSIKPMNKSQMPTPFKKPMNKILIANRGEIAIRIIRTARDLGYRTVAIYSEADYNARHVIEADQAVCVGKASVGESYLVIENIIAAAIKTHADAIHPGYGFLSENADFALSCEQAGITFIGPSASAIKLMGSKRLSKLAMLDAGVPCVPGYEGDDQNVSVLLEKAQHIGFPLMVKASAGGGGRGMRLVTQESELSAQISTARSEALNAFGSGELILERAIMSPRHIEIQIFADSLGNTIYLGERDCSIQRRHQKVVEESPSPFVDDTLRKKMGDAAVKAAKSCQYQGAGTVEFLVDSDKNFYFLEMNTRLQVEHPVTEFVTGEDLVAWQLLVAAGEALPLSQEEVQIRGHAIEVRLYAEDPRHDFIPQTGNILRWQPPAHRQGIRIDSGIKDGDKVSTHYDPMLAKIIAFGDNRAIASRRLASAVEDTVLIGVNSNKHFLKQVLTTPAFVAGKTTTSFIQQHLDGNKSTQETTLSLRSLACAATIYFQQDNKLSTWRSAAGQHYQFTLEHNAHIYEVHLVKQEDSYTIKTNGGCITLTVVGCSNSQCVVVENNVREAFHFTAKHNTLFLDDGSGHYVIENITHQPAQASASASSGDIKAVMDGVMVEVLVCEGDTVEAGQLIAVMEAMKMEHQLKTEIGGVVKHVGVTVGQQVKLRQRLVAVQASDGT